MILKGPYDTKVDRMKEAAYTTYMMNTFGIQIRSDTKHTKIKGFIISGLWYDIYIPVLIDGEISSLMVGCMRHLGSRPDMVAVKMRIKEDIKNRPDYYRQLADSMAKITSGEI